MCLHLPSQLTRVAARALKPKIAKRNIVVYKDVTRHLGRNNNWVWYSPYRGFKYDANKTYKIRHLVKTITRSHDGYENVWACHIYRGFHAYTTKYNLFSERKIRMIIPKGAKYYISECGEEIVSNQIRTPKTLKYVH